MSSLAGHTTYYRVHPEPPPTVNNLSSRQKAQLRRSTTKLTKVLGAAPQVVDDCPPKISSPFALSAAKRMQPTVSVTSGKALHGRAKSASEHIDPDLYPLSSALRPATRETHRRRPSEASLPSNQLKRRSTISSRTSTESLRRSRSRSLSVDLSPSSGQKVGGNGSVMPRPRPLKEDDARPQSFSRDSLCDSLYEPAFNIPSSTSLRREKMARICKLLGEGVPVDLVFPATEVAEDYKVVLDIRPPSAAAELEVLTETPPPPPPKQTLVGSPKAEQLRRTSNRARMLETIVESPRSSSSSNFSACSGSSLLTTTTSSSYRFTSSPCSSSPSSSSSHETTTSSDLVHPVHEIDGTHGRREFAIYVPFRRWPNNAGCSAEAERRVGQKFEPAKGMVDLRN
ncbi:hypothetical protein DFH11DRAFT_1514732 [Phellopilus nigrolimitatus]|nr:hypothetical protein DFH11DRAFT_1514732 [Phellopilus nigrolimitatus]